jgi:transposase InsO family protein
MVTQDLYSRFVEIDLIDSVEGNTVIPILTRIFNRFGWPEKIKTDNGPPFNSHRWQQFAKDYRFKHKATTPYWAQANGLVERFMKNITKQCRVAQILGKHYSTQIEVFLAHYRNTPHPATRCTPTSLIFRHEVNTTQLPQVITIEKSQHDLIAEANDQGSYAKV